VHQKVTKITPYKCYSEHLSLCDNYYNLIVNKSFHFMKLTFEKAIQRPNQSDNKAVRHFA